jgi:glycosyltransferase involved in cell wall biosynthesis
MKTARDIPSVARPVRVAYVYVHLRPGGAERHLQTALQFLDRRRFEPSVLCLTEPGAIGEQIRAAGVPLASFGLPRHGLWRPRGLLRVARRLRLIRPGIVHTHMYHANTYGRIAAALARAPRVVATVHTTGGHRLLKQRLMNRLLDPMTDRTIAVSEEGRRTLLAEGGIAPGKTAVIHNGVDLRRFRLAVSAAEARARIGVPPDALVVAAVARLEPEKRHADLLEAFRRVRAETPAARLLLAGDGSLNAALRKEVDRMGMGECVALLGHRDDVPELLRATDVFVLPSSREGSPLAVIEAMASAVPVVASAVGGIPEMVGPGAGVLFRAGDVAALTAALRQMAARPDLRAAMGAAGRERAAAEFSAERMAAQLQSLYDECLA